jgi:hypothetical protein
MENFMLIKTQLTAVCIFAVLFFGGCPNQTRETSVGDAGKPAMTEKNEPEKETGGETKVDDESPLEKKEADETAGPGKVYTPERGSAERKAIFDALRVPIEKELKQKIIFAPSQFKVFNDWAFVGGEPLAKSGGKPDYKGTVYEEDVESDMFDNNFFALLKKSDGRWKIIKYYIGCTDVCYLEWPKEYKAPKEIFPGT